MSTAVEQHAGEENPLVEGLERLPVHPTALVIFGATGDLAHRKLLPALYNLAHEGALPERFELIGVSRRDAPDEDFRAIARESIERFSRRKPDPDVLDGLLANVRYVPGRSTTPRSTRSSGARWTSSTSRPAAGSNRVFYLSTAPEFFPVIAGQLGEAGPARMREGRRPDRDREAVRVRPGLGAQAQRPGAGRVRRDAGLPDRPLPRQGDGPEPDGAAVRQRAVRAGLEPQLHRQRPDHRRRGHRDRRPRRLLRGRGRAARPRPEPHDAAARAAGDGAAGLVRGQPPARREGQGARGDRAADGRARCARWRCARSTAPATSAGTRVPGYREEPGVAAGLADRDLRGAAARRLQLALGRRAVLPADRQAAGAQGDRDRGARSSPSRTSRSRAAGRSACRPTRSSSRSSPTRACRSRSGRRSRARGCGSARSTWSSATGPRSCPSRPRPTSG